MRLLLLLATFLSCLVKTSEARSIFVNGVDISSTTNQLLKRVNVRIDNKGNIFISAPHYEVRLEDSYTPLSMNADEPKRPVHTPPTQLNLESSKQQPAVAPASPTASIATPTEPASKSNAPPEPEEPPTKLEVD